MLVTEMGRSMELDEEDEFNMMLSELGILGLVEDDTSLREMWAELRGGGGDAVDPELAARFERFLTGLSVDLRKKTTEHERMEDAARVKSQMQEEQLNRLYEEMESQLGAERKQLREEEERREQKIKEEWEATMLIKEQQVGK